MGKLPYENYIFDLYGTLVDIHTEEERPEAWAALARFYSYYGADYAPRELQQAFRRMTAERTAGREAPRRESHEACPEIEIEEVFLALFRQKGAAAGRELAVHTGQFFRAMTTDRLRLYDGVPALLRTLRQRGGRVYLLSNAQQIFTAHEMQALGLTPYFDAVYLSSACGCKKPDPRFFARLLTGQRLKPEKSIMVGNDGLCDIEGARQAGLATLYVRSNLSPEEDWPQADFTLPAMDIPAMGRLLTGAAAGQPAPL